MFPSYASSVPGLKAHPVFLQKRVRLPCVREDAIEPGILGFAILPDGEVPHLEAFQSTCSIVRARYDELVEHNLIVLPDGSKVVILPSGSRPQHAQVVYREDEGAQVFVEVIFLYQDARVIWRAPLFRHPLIERPMPERMLS